MPDPSIEARRLEIDEARLALEREREQFARRFLNRNFGAVATAIIALAGVAFSVVQWVDSTRRGGQEAAAATVRANRDFDMETYRLATASLSRRDTVEQLAALKLVALVNDSGLRDGLLEALAQSRAPAVRREAREQATAERRFALDQAALHTADAPVATLRFDVFACANSGPAAQAFADTVRRELADLALPERAPVRQAVARLRILPPSVNSRAGYRARGYEVRTGPSEMAVARALVGRVARVAGPERRFRLVELGAWVPRYISVFICP